MSRNLTNNFKEEANKSFNRPIELYQIYLDEETLYFAAHDQPVNYFDESGNAQTYNPIAITRRPVKNDTEMQANNPEIQVDNVGQEMSAYVVNTEFQGRRVVIWKVFLDRLDDPNGHAIIFDGYMDEPRLDDNYLSISLTTPLDVLKERLPRQTFQTTCPWTFGHESTCGKTVNSKNIVISSISADRMTVSSADITEASGYWDFGAVVIGKQSRVINSSGTDHVRLEFPLPADMSVGDTIKLEAGCDKTFDGGHGCQFWNNTQYYRGFQSIPNVEDVRTFGGSR